MSNIIELNRDNFEDIILNSQKSAVVDFTAEWSGGSQKLEQLMEDISCDYSDSIFFYRVNIDSIEDIASRYHVTSIPSLLFFKNGEVVNRVTGLTSREEITEKMSSCLL